MPDTDGLAYVDGQIMALKVAQVPLADRGFLLGDGVFETLRASHGQVFRWDLHEARLRLGLAVIGIHHAAADVAKDAVRSLVRAAGEKLGDSLYVRVQVARDRNVREPEDTSGSVTALTRPLEPYPERMYRDGILLDVATWRKDPSDPLSAVKHLSYLPYLMVRRRAHRSGADDALILNTHGRVCEASHSNVLAVVGDAVHAPGKSEGALDGVTRHVLLDAIRREGFSIIERLDVQALSNAEELFVVNTVGGVVPVKAVQGLDAGRIEVNGPMGVRLRRAYEAALDSSRRPPSV